MSLPFLAKKPLDIPPIVSVELIQIAPLNDPLYICVNGSHLAIRKETAAKIQIIKAK